MLKTDDEVVIHTRRAGAVVRILADGDVYLDAMMTIAAPDELIADQNGNVRIWVRRR